VVDPNYCQPILITLQNQDVIEIFFAFAVTKGYSIDLTIKGGIIQVYLLKEPTFC
jgi:hypothetical protein